MTGFIMAKQAAVLWEISERRITTLCKQGRVDGAEKAGNTWLIPSDAKKPKDARRKNKYKIQP